MPKRGADPLSKSRCSLRPAPRPCGTCCPALLCTWGHRASAPGSWGSSPRTSETLGPKGIREVDFRYKHLSLYISRFGCQMRRPSTLL